MSTIMFKMMILFVPVLVLKPHVLVCQLLRVPVLELVFQLLRLLYLQSIQKLNRFIFLFLYLTILFLTVFCMIKKQRINTLV